MYITTINENSGHEFSREQGLEAGKEGEMTELYYSLKNI